MDKCIAMKLHEHRTVVVVDEMWVQICQCCWTSINQRGQDGFVKPQLPSVKLHQPNSEIVMQPSLLSDLSGSETRQNTSRSLASIPIQSPGDMCHKEVVAEPWIETIRY